MVMNHKNHYPNLEKIIEESFSYAEVLRKYNVVPAGGNYFTLKKLIKERGINISHFTGKAWNVGIRYRPVVKKMPILEKLVKDTYWSSSSLRKDLIREGLKREECERCGITKWNGEDISLHLDHIDEDHSNNLLENLQILCPNCHSQKTHKAAASKKESKKYKRLKEQNSEGFDNPLRKIKTLEEKLDNNCLDCNISVSQKALRCKRCCRFWKDNTKIEWPSVKELDEMLRKSNYTQVGILLGVSDNAIRKHIRSHRNRE